MWAARGLARRASRWYSEPTQRQNSRRSSDGRQGWKELNPSTQALGRMRRIQMRRCFLCALWRHVFTGDGLPGTPLGPSHSCWISFSVLRGRPSSQIRPRAHFRDSGQRKAKDCSTSGIRTVLELAAVDFGDRWANRETEPNAVPFADRNTSKRCWRFPNRGRDLNHLIVEQCGRYFQIISGPQSSHHLRYAAD
jgi:hypothetical protein